MLIHNLYIFDRKGTLLYYGEWNRTKQSGMSIEEEGKLMYGVLCTIKSFIAKISPKDPDEGFIYYKTSKYTINYLEAPSGIQFAMNTDNVSMGSRELMKKMYNDIFVKYVVRNPMCVMGEPITSELFKNKLDAFIKQAPLNTTRSS